MSVQTALPDATNSGPLVKQRLAAALREEIIRGHLAPGHKVVEGTWAKHFGVTQSSVREAINLLIQEGFVTKNSGRSARVVNYSEREVAKIYEVRAVLEGSAARLIVQHQPDLTPLTEALQEMEAAIDSRDMRRLIASDLQFHLVLCELSANHFLYELARRILLPLFAFVLMRVLHSGQGPEPWSVDWDRHRLILEILKEGDPVVAEQYVRHSIQRFVTAAYAVWANFSGSLEAHRLGANIRRQKGQKQE